MTQLKTAPEAMSLTGEVVEFRLGFNHDKEGLLVWKDRDVGGGVKALPTNDLLTGYIKAVTVTQADIRTMVQVKMRDGWDRDMLIRFVAEAAGEGVNLTGLRLLAELSSAHPGVKVQLANMQSPSRHGLGVVAGAYQMGFALHANYGTGRPNVVPLMHLRSEALKTVLARLQAQYPESEMAPAEESREARRFERQR